MLVRVNTLFLVIILNTCISFTYGQQQKNIQKDEYTVNHADYLYNESRRLGRRYSDSAIAIGNRLLEISETIDYPIGIAKAKEAIARANIFKKPDSLSIQMAHEAFDYAKSIGADSILMETINLLGGGYYRTKQIHRTYEYNRLGFKYAKENGNWEKQFLFTSNAASIMADLEEYDKAMDFFKESIEILEVHPDSLSYQLLFYNMSKINLNAGNASNALANLNTSKAYNSQYSTLSNTLELLILEADIFINLKRLTEADKALKQAEEIGENSKDSRTLADLRLVRAKFFRENGEIEKAKNSALDGLELAKISNYIRTKQLLFEELYDISLSESDYKAANDFIRSSLKLQDSIKFADNQTKVKIAIAENNFVKEQEILNLELQRASALQRYIAIIAALIIISLIAIVYLIKRNERSLKSLNFQLEERTKSLDEANDSKNKIFSIIAHDFKGPIAGLKNLVDMLISKQLSEEEFSMFIPKLKNRVDHVLYSLTNLLYWGSGQLERSTTEPIALNIREKIEDAIFLLKERIQTKELSIINNVSQNTIVFADSNHLEIIIRNLLSNAIKFTPDFGVISFNAEDRDSSWVISIKDTGVGMAKSIQDQIFKKEVAVTTYGTNNEKGTGIGLSLCADLVNKNKGEIWVESLPEVGTTIYICLPKIT